MPLPLGVATAELVEVIVTNLQVVVLDEVIVEVVVIFTELVVVEVVFVELLVVLDLIVTERFDILSAEDVEVVVVPAALLPLHVHPL